MFLFKISSLPKFSAAHLFADGLESDNCDRYCKKYKAEKLLEKY
jgi:hypothetical protein